MEQMPSPCNAKGDLCNSRKSDNFYRGKGDRENSCALHWTKSGGTNNFGFFSRRLFVPSFLNLWHCPCLTYGLNCTRSALLIARKNYRNFCHQMSYFTAIMHQIQCRLSFHGISAFNQILLLEFKGSYFQDKKKREKMDKGKKKEKKRERKKEKRKQGKKGKKRKGRKGRKMEKKPLNLPRPKKSLSYATGN